MDIMSTVVASGICLANDGCKRCCATFRCDNRTRSPSLFRRLAWECQDRRSATFVRFLQGENMTRWKIVLLSTLFAHSSFAENIPYDQAKKNGIQKCLPAVQKISEFLQLLTEITHSGQPNYPQNGSQNRLRRDVLASHVRARCIVP